MQDWVLAGAPRVRVGGSGGYAFGSVRGAHLVQDTILVVADSYADQIIEFDLAGRVVRRLGGEGRGPGEFRLLAGLLVTSDSLVSGWDLQNRRLTTFSVDGVRTSSTPLRTDSIPLNMPRAEGVLSDGGCVVISFMHESSVLEGWTGVRRDSVPLLVFDPDGGIRWVLRVPGHEMYHQKKGGRLMASSLLLGRETLVAVSSTRVWVGDNGSRTITAFGPRGDSVASLELPVGPRPVTETERKALERRRNTMPVPGAVRDASVPSRETFPFYDELLVDGLDRIWVRESVGPLDELQRWWIFDHESRLVGRLELPTDLEVLSSDGDDVVVLHKDELDVPEVRAHAMIRR